MAELGVGTLNMTITADGSAAIGEIDRVGAAAQRMAGEAANGVKSAGQGMESAYGGAADAAEAAGEAGARAGEKAAQGAQKAHKSLKEVADVLSKAGTQATKFVTLPIVAAMTASVKGASDLAETVSKTEVVFDRLSDRVMAWSEDSVNAMGLAQGSALEYASTFGDMGKGMGLALDTATEMSMNLTQLAADLSSFKNIRTDVAAQKLNAVYTGETEGLKSLGIVMTQTNLQAFALSQGITKQVSAMSQAELVALRYQYVMNATKDAQGDFARTGDSLANQTRKLGETVKQLGESFGSQLIPMITPVVEKIQQWVQHIAELDSRTKNMIISIAAVAAAVGPLLLVGGKLLGFLATLKASLAALSINPALLAIGAVVAAGMAIAGLNRALNRASGDVDDTSAAYQRMKAAVEKGAAGKVTVDKTELDNLETEKQITITANGKAALDRAEAIATELNSGKYDGQIAIDGDPEKAEAVLAQVEQDIRDAKESVTIDGDGNAVIGDAGLVNRIKADIAKLEGLVVITEDEPTRRLLEARIRALKRELTGFVAGVSFEGLSEDDDAALRAFKEELAGLPKDETFKGYGKFTYDDTEKKNLEDFNNAMMEAAGKVGDFQGAVERMNQAVDADLQEAIKQVLDQTSDQIDILTAVYKNGGLSYEQYIAAIQQEIDAKDAEITRLRQQAEDQKEVNKRLSNGTEKDDAETVGQIKLEQYERNGGTQVTPELTNQNLALIDQAEDRSAMQLEGMTALLGLTQQAQAQYEGLTAAVDTYNQAQTEAAEQEESAAALERQAEAYGRLEGPIETYLNALNVTSDAEEAFAMAQAAMGENADPVAIEALSAALRDENGELLRGAAAYEAIEAAQRLEGETADKAAEAQAQAMKTRQSAAEELQTALGELKDGDFLSSQGAEGALIEIGETGVDISGAEQALVTGIPAAVEAAYTAAETAAQGGTDPAAAIAAAVETSAGLVQAATEGAVSSATAGAGAAASSGGQSVGSQMAAGVESGINSGSGAVAAAGRRMISEALAGMRAEAAIKSPSRKARDLVGRPLAQGVGAGYEMETPSIVRTVRRSTERLISGAADVVRRGAYTAPALAAAGPQIDYGAMGSAMEQAMGRVRFGFSVGGRELAQATREANAQQLAVQSRQVANRYGG